MASCITQYTQLQQLNSLKAQPAPQFAPIMLISQSPKKHPGSIPQLHTNFSPPLPTINAILVNKQAKNNGNRQKNKNNSSLSYSKKIKNANLRIWMHVIDNTIKNGRRLDLSKKQCCDQWNQRESHHNCNHHKNQALISAQSKCQPNDIQYEIGYHKGRKIRKFINSETKQEQGTTKTTKDYRYNKFRLQDQKDYHLSQQQLYTPMTKNYQIRHNQLNNFRMRNNLNNHLLQFENNLKINSKYRQDKSAEYIYNPQQDCYKFKDSKYKINTEQKYLESRNQKRLTQDRYKYNKKSSSQKQQNPNTQYEHNKSNRERTNAFRNLNCLFVNPYQHQIGQQKRLKIANLVQKQKQQMNFKKKANVQVLETSQIIENEVQEVQYEPPNMQSVATQTYNNRMQMTPNRNRERRSSFQMQYKKLRAQIQLQNIQKQQRGREQLNEKQAISDSNINWLRCLFQQNVVEIVKTGRQQKHQHQNMHEQSDQQIDKIIVSLQKQIQIQAKGEVSEIICAICQAGIEYQLWQHAKFYQHDQQHEQNSNISQNSLNYQIGSPLYNPPSILISQPAAQQIRSQLLMQSQQQLAQRPVEVQAQGQAEQSSSLSNAPMLLHCGHSFHKNCLNQWFQYKTICPLCKTQHRNNRRGQAADSSDASSSIQSSQDLFSQNSYQYEPESYSLDGGGYEIIRNPDQNYSPIQYISFGDSNMYELMPYHQNLPPTPSIPIINNNIDTLNIQLSFASSFSQSQAETSNILLYYQQQQQHRHRHRHRYGHQNQNQNQYGDGDDQLESVVNSIGLDSNSHHHDISALSFRLPDYGNNQNAQQSWLSINNSRDLNQVINNHDESDDSRLDQQSRRPRFQHENQLKIWYRRAQEIIKDKNCLNSHNRKQSDNQQIDLQQSQIIFSQALGAYEQFLTTQQKQQNPQHITQFQRKDSQNQQNNAKCHNNNKKPILLDRQYYQQKRQQQTQWKFNRQAISVRGQHQVKQQQHQDDYDYEYNDDGCDNDCDKEQKCEQNIQENSVKYRQYINRKLQTIFKNDQHNNNNNNNNRHKQLNNADSNAHKKGVIGTFSGKKIVVDMDPIQTNGRLGRREHRINKHA